MHAKTFAALTAVLLGVSAVSAAAQDDTAKDLPVNAPPNAVVKSAGGLYVWGDGGPWTLSQQKTANTNVDPNAAPGGAQSAPAASSTANLALPAASAAVTRGGIGYVLPSGTLAPKWGSKVRAEFSASEVTASVPHAAGVDNPLVYNGIALGGCNTCSSASTDYSSHELVATMASDYNLDRLTLTPSVSVFNSQTRQSFAGDSVSPALQWNDIGARLGVEAKYDFNNEIAIGVGGSYGIAQRSVTMSVDENARDTAMPHLANGEAKLTYKPGEAFSFKGYAGIGNYDNKVPGVANAGGGIDYAPATNVYYGAGATYRFGTK